MEGEMGTGARIAIVLIILGVLISVVFTILGFTRSTTNQGISTVQNSLQSMQLAQFDDYDQKMQSGTQVTAALKLFEGRPIGMLVRTKALIEGGTDGGYNYGALFDDTDTTSTGDGEFLNDEYAKKEDTDSFYTINLDMSGGKMTHNMQYLIASESGKPQFIRPTAKFLAELIKDETGTIVGILFTQQ